jgi:hypothetical protein
MFSSRANAPLVFSSIAASELDNEFAEPKHLPTVNSRNSNPDFQVLSWVDSKLSDKVAWAILIGCLSAFSIGKFAAVVLFTPHDQSIFDLGVALGAYVQTLTEHGHFAACIGPACSTAARMPLLPLLYCAIGFISRDQRTAGLIKAVLLSAIFFPSFFYLLRVNRAFSRHAIQCWSVIGLLLFLSPPVMKHAAAVSYEEGILVEVLFLWAYAYLLLILSYVRQQGAANHVRALAILTTSLALLAYLTKSSMVLILLLSALTTLFMAIRLRDIWAGVAFVFSFCVVAGWGLRNELVSGHFSVMTSWDGGNAFRGWNGESAKLYPDVVLDQIFRTKIAYLADGTMVTIRPTLPATPPRNEWEWYGWYQASAVQWATTHRWDALRFSARKIYFFLVSIRKTPYSFTIDARDSLRPSAELYMTDGWLFVGRCMQFFLLVMVWMLWRTRDTASRYLAGAAVAVCVAYAAPYLVGFGYERHVTVFLVIVGVSCAVLSAEVWAYLERETKSS